MIPIQEIGKRQSGTPQNGVGYGQPGDPIFTWQANAVHGVCAYDGSNSKGPVETSYARTAHKGGNLSDFESETFIAHSLTSEGFDASEDGTGRGTPLICGALNANGKAAGSATQQDAETGMLLPVAFAQNQRQEVRELSVAGSQSSIRRGDAKKETLMAQGMAVRRLTLREVERLQGFPDDYTLIPYRGKPACDGPRYRALGNSFAVPVVRWIGERIQLVENLTKKLNPPVE